MRAHDPVQLPRPFPSFGTYEMAARTGDLVVTAGHVPAGDDGLVTGALGRDLTVEQGYEAARLAGASLLATLDDALGDLGRVERVVSVLATINATADFTDHTRVADGASDVIVEVLGEAGRHARLAVGVVSLPADVALEVQAVVAVRPDATPAG